MLWRALLTFRRSGRRTHQEDTNCATGTARQWSDQVADRGVQSRDVLAPAAAVPPPPPHPFPEPSFAAVGAPAAEASASLLLARQGNGFAVAALVLGIIGVLTGLIPLLFFIVVPCGVLAFIFGLLGRRAAKRSPDRPRRGQATAGVVLGLVAAVLGVVGFVIVGNVINDAADSLGRAAPSSYDITTVDCSVSEFGLANASGNIANTSDHTRSFDISVDFLDNAGTRVGDGVDIVNDLAAGQSAEWSVTDSVNRDVGTPQCQIRGVDNFFSN